MNIITHIPPKDEEKRRYRDWVILDDPKLSFNVSYDKYTFEHRVIAAPYEYKKIEYMYISGAYWVAKKYVMEEEPLNEDIGWAEPPGEDVEWSKRVLTEDRKYSYVMNTNSMCIF